MTDETIEAVARALLKGRGCDVPAAGQSFDTVQFGTIALNDAKHCLAALSAIPDERAAIVAWLRSDADQLQADAFPRDILLAEVVRECADAIEAGAHLAGDGR